MTTDVDLKTQASGLLTHVAGYIAHRTITVGLRHGLIDAFADLGGATTATVTAERGLDQFYVEVWTRSALADGVIERAGDGYTLAPHVRTLLLDDGSPAYIGGVFGVFEQPEMFDRFDQSLASGERMWWNDTSPEWIHGVSLTGRPFYTRLIPDGLRRVPGLADTLASGARILETACGAGVGLERLAAAYPSATVVGVDGDQYSLELAAKRLDQAGLSQRVELVHSPLEQLDLHDQFDVAINNIPMHECRDIHQVTAVTRQALAPRGWFVISDFPFPDDDNGLRSVPGRLMSGIQFFEAQIDDQLLPRAFYDDLLARHGFTDIDSTVLTPLHALTWGRASR